MPVKRVTIKEGDKSQDVYIAMTDEEANDRSYVDYLQEAQKEKVSNELRKSKPREVSKLPDDDKSGAIKEWIKHRDEKKKRSGPKYYSGF